MRERDKAVGGGGGQKLKAEIDRDRGKESKKWIHYGRSSSRLESVYLFSQQEKSYGERTAQ